MPRKPYVVDVGSVRQERAPGNNRGPLTAMLMDNQYVQWSWTREGAVGDAPSTRPHDQLCYMYEGHMEWTIEGEEYQVGPGQALYIPAGATRQGRGGPAHLVEIMGGILWDRLNFADHQIRAGYRDWTHEA